MMVMDVVLTMMSQMVVLMMMIRINIIITINLYRAHSSEPFSDVVHDKYTRTNITTN